MTKDKKKITSVHVVLFADEVMDYFHPVIKGWASDIAYYELLIGGERYLKKPNKDFEETLDFMFNIKKKDLTEIKKRYRKKIKEAMKLIS